MRKCIKLLAFVACFCYWILLRKIRFKGPAVSSKHSSVQGTVFLTAVAGVHETKYVRNFLNSWQRNIRNSHAVFFITAETSQAVVDFIKSFQNTKIIMMTENKDLPLNSFRFIAYRDFLLVHTHLYKLVFLSDARDVVFQSDPFETLVPIESRSVFATNEGVETGKSIGSCPMNSRWVHSCFGNATYDNLKHRPISCAGTILGEIKGIIAYVEAMIPYLMKGCNDQGVHNFIAHTHRSPKFNIATLTNENSPILTCGYYNMWSTHLIGGTLYKKDGLAPAVVHQYDRSWITTLSFRMLYS